MNIDTLIEADLESLARVTESRARSPQLTEGALRAASVQRRAHRRRRAIAAAVAMSCLAIGLGAHWNTVYAIGRDVMFRIVLDLTHQSDPEAEADIRDQLDAQGWQSRSVSVRRTEDDVSVALSADDEAGRHIELRRHEPAGAQGAIELAPEPIDDTREPGMTDAQLRDKILQQLRSRGLEDVQVTVSGDDVRVLVKRAPPR